MKFKINAAELVGALGSVFDVSIKNTLKGVDTENMITIKSDKNKITALSFGGSAGVISEINKDYFEDISYKSIDIGEATVDAKIMMQSLSVFGPSDVDIELESNQLVVSLCDDKDFIQRIPTYDMIVSLPKIATDFSIEISINREVLIGGIRKVQFAMGFEETRPQYLCLILETFKDKVRFLAGNGGQFAISDVRGPYIIKGAKSEIVFPRNNISNIISILSNSSADDIKIKYAKKDDDNNIPAQIVLKFDGTCLCLFKIDSKIKSQNVQKVLDFDYPNRVVNSISEWKRSIAGINAAEMGDKGSEKISVTEVTLNNKKKCLYIETKGELKSKSKVNFKEVDSVIVDNKPWFKCISTYIKNISTQCSLDSGDITLNFQNQQPPEGVASSSHRIEPILVNYPDDKNGPRDTVESFKLFFVATTL